MSILRVSEIQWLRAQRFEKEFASANMLQGDDWNVWWKHQFNDYSEIRNKIFHNALEVGCGSHTNMLHILQGCEATNLFMEDPLIWFYLTGGKRPDGIRNQISWVTRKQTGLQLLAERYNEKFNATAHPLEDLPYRNESMNLVVCINVLDHVRDFDLCMFEIKRVLAPGGYLVLGQDLTNGDDVAQCPEILTDAGHPIRVSKEIVEASVENYRKCYYTVLPRKNGRNPRCHYATYIGILQKPEKVM